MTETQTRIESTAVARISARPQLTRTGPGFPICRFTVTTDEEPARNPVVMPVFLFGGPTEWQRRLALLCGGLRVGELIQVTGLQRQRVRRTKGKKWLETALAATDVQVLGAGEFPVSTNEPVGYRRGLVVHCMSSPYEVYIGRGKDPHTDELSQWGNRYSHRESKFEDVIYVETAEEAVERYRADLWERIRSGELSLEKLASLAGKTLACWCAPSCCHGDVLAGASIWAVDELARQRSSC